ncbi:small GTP-binding protein, partial [mine drainage metagenome]
VGKSSLVSRVVYGSDNAIYDPKSLKRKSVTFEKSGVKLNADIFFLELGSKGGEDKLLAGSNAIVIVSDVTNSHTLEEAEMLLKYTRAFSEKSVIILVGTKQDLRYEAQFWEEELKEVADRYKVTYILTSAKTNADSGRFLEGLVSSLSSKFLVKGKN